MNFISHIYISQGSVVTQLGVVVYFITTLQMFHRMCRWKKLKIGPYLAKIWT